MNALHKLHQLPKAETGAADAAVGAAPSITGEISADEEITEAEVILEVEVIEADMVKEGVVIPQQHTLDSPIIITTRANMGSMVKAQDKDLGLTKFTSILRNTPKDTAIKEKPGPTCGRS